MTFRPERNLRIRIFDESGDPAITNIRPAFAAGIWMGMSAIFLLALSTVFFVVFVNAEAALRVMMLAGGLYALLAGVEWSAGMRGHARNDLITAAFLVFVVAIFTRAVS